MAIAAAEHSGAQSRTKWRRFKVDLWLTDLNTTEIGILKDTQHQAESDQFSKDMEIIGQIVDDGDRTGILGYRKELWKEGEGLQRRLVIKQFTDSMNWKGSMELMMGRSLQLSVGSRGIPVCAYTVNLARHDQLIQLERSGHKWPFMPEHFSFFIETRDGPRFYRLRRNMFAIGADYSLYDARARKIGHLDHRIINLGGSWKVKIREAETNAQLETVIQLFCTMLRFNHEMRDHVRAQMRALKRGQDDESLDHHETSLYHNPRKYR